MKLHELQALAQHFQNFTFISRARRIEDNTIEITFDKHKSYFFQMTRGNSLIYKAPSQRPLQDYQAPFDTLLHSLLSGSRLLKVEIPHSDRVLRFTLAPKSSYKDKIISFQLEFTGKHTNAILIDEDEVIIEALRHIDTQSSFRMIRPGTQLLPLPPLQSLQKEDKTPPLPKDLDSYLEERFLELQAQKLSHLKRQKSLTLQKKIVKLKQLLEKLPNKEMLEEKAEEYQKLGHLILANLHQINPYDKRLNTDDFNGEPISITLPKNIVVNRMGDYYFNLAKRAKAKAKSVHIEEENLSSKKAFYENIAQAIQEAKTPYEIELLVPKRAKSLRKKERLKEGELFWIEGYKVMVGRNSQENQKLLSLAKSNDIWMHTRHIAGSHVIIRTDKQNLPQSLLEAAAKLCVDFSTKQTGHFLVDYTKRKFVKIQEGSHVEYDKYQTLTVLKEGVEIRL